MDFQITLSPRAIRDLQEIVRYVSFDNPTRAESFGRELIAKTKMLISFPQIGRVVPEFDETNVREIIHCSYRIVYRVNHEKHLIEVARFWHGARGTPKL